MKRVIEILLGGTLSLSVAFILVFIFVNMILGCESWDRDLWTENNSCVTVGMLLDFQSAQD